MVGREVLQVSTGVKQPKRPSCHSRAVSGDLELMCSAGLLRTSVKRCFQSSISTLSMPPAPAVLVGWAGEVASVVMVAIVLDLGNLRNGAIGAIKWGSAETKLKK